MKTQKHYLMNDNMVISDAIPAHENEIKAIIELPAGDYLKIKSRDKSYHVSKIVRAIAAGQITIDDVEQE